MDDKGQKEVVHGYKIIRAVTFDNDRGFALAENPAAVAPFVTWQLTEENGVSELAALPVPEVESYKYYSTQRPVDIGTFPKTVAGHTLSKTSIAASLWSMGGLWRGAFWNTLRRSQASRWTITSCDLRSEILTAVF